MQLICLRGCAAHLRDVRGFGAPSRRQLLAGRRTSTRMPPLLNDTTAGSVGCVPCPPCLQQYFHGCAERLRRHRDCKTLPGTRALCSRDIFECPNTGFFFTHPTIQPQELSKLYAAGFPGRTARTSDPRHPRLQAQAEFIHHHFPRLSKSALVVEIGCSHGNLLQKLALRTRTLVCFEPTPAAAHAAEATLRNKTDATVHVFTALWDPALLRQAVGDRMINLLVSSHVMEHLPDLCQFSLDLGPMIASDGIVFAEVCACVWTRVRDLPLLPPQSPTLACTSHTPRLQTRCPRALPSRRSRITPVSTCVRDKAARSTCPSRRHVASCS